MKNLFKSFMGEMLINIFFVIYAFGILLFEKKIYGLSSLVFGVFFISVSIFKIIKFINKIKKVENKKNPYEYIDLIVPVLLLILGIVLFISIDILKFNISIILIIYIVLSLVNKFSKLDKLSDGFYLNLFNYCVMTVSPLILLLNIDINQKIFIMLLVYVLANMNFIFGIKKERY